MSKRGNSFVLKCFFSPLLFKLDSTKMALLSFNSSEFWLSRTWEFWERWTEWTLGCREAGGGGGAQSGKVQHLQISEGSMVQEKIQNSMKSLFIQYLNQLILISYINIEKVQTNWRKNYKIHIYCKYNLYVNLHYVYHSLSYC